MATSLNSKPAILHRKALAPEADFLSTLGKRIREVRNRRGMTRKVIARDADVSERHLAQLEVGEGNVSIVILRRIARALKVSVAELFAPATKEPNEKQLTSRFLERLPAHRLEDV